MNIKRSLVIAAAAGSAAVWIAAAATSGIRDVAPSQSLALPAIDASGAGLAGEVARLHDRLRPTTPPRLARNPFRFSVVRPRTPVAAPEREPVVPPAVAALPVMRLVGIAESAADHPDRTAIISTSSDLLLVKEGDSATPRYRVEKIGADVVELSDSTDGTTRRLALPE